MISTSRRFQFSLRALLLAMTLVSVNVASVSALVREPSAEAMPLVLNTAIWSSLGTAGVFADDRTNSATVVFAALAMIAFGFFAYSICS